MKSERQPLLLKLLPSFADLAFLLPIALLFGRMDGMGTLLGDCDTGWHIRAGEWILAHRAVPASDIFSYTKPGAPWFAWEWLSDAVFAVVNHAGGLRGLAIFAILLLSAIMLIAFRLACRRSNAIVAFSVTMIAAAASSIHWLARPHLFTLLFALLFYGALERVREGRGRIAGIPLLAILPAATIVWTNLHGGFVVGIVMVGAYGVGELLRLAFSGEEQGRAARREAARNYLLCALACLAASLINPYFYHLHVHVAQYLRDPFNLKIGEFGSPDFHGPTSIFLEAMLALAVPAAGWSIARRSFVELLLVLIWAHAALLAKRNIPIFVLLAVPMCAAMVQEWVERVPRLNAARWLRSVASRFNQLAARTEETEAVARWHVISAAAVLLVAAVIWAPNPPKKFRAEFDPNRFPAKALSAVPLDASNRVFAHDQWGDYVIWKFYPAQKVFLDGRSDFYGTDFEEKCMDVFRVKHGWEETLSRFGVDTILLPVSAPLAGALKESSRWKPVYDDGVALVFRPAERAGAATVSVAAIGGGSSRDREITKTRVRDQAAIVIKPKT